MLLCHNTRGSAPPELSGIQRAGPAGDRSRPVCVLAALSGCERRPGQQDGGGRLKL
jgi:hypothetical protein